MLVISGRANTRKFIHCGALYVLFVAFVVSPMFARDAAFFAARTPHNTWFLAVPQFMMQVLVGLIVVQIVALALSLHRPYLTADAAGLRVRTGPMGTTQHIGWDEISHAYVSVVKGPDVLWKGSSRWQWRTLYVHAADPAYFGRQGWRGQISRFLSGGAAFAISEQLAAPQFDELVALVNAHLIRPA